MRLPTGKRTLRTGLSITALMVVSATLAGCVTTGGSLISNEVTASTGVRPVSDLSQPMPPAAGQPGGAQSQVLAAVAPPGPFTPPGNVGATPGPQNQLQNQMVAQNQLMARDSAARTRTALASPSLSSSTPLPPLTPSSQESNATMSAQSAALQTPASIPQNAGPGSAPTLSVVPQNAFYHTIISGESLYAIARRYAVSTDAIVQANQLVSADKIFVGQRVVIPGRPDLAAAERGRLATAAGTTIKPAPVLAKPTAPATGTVKTASIAPTVATAPVAASPAVAQAMPAATAVPSAGKFRWPVQGRLIADFKASKGTGINIEVPEGAAIRAAEAGTVIYTGNGVEGYGNLILIRHTNGFVSAYAHLKDIGVTKGDLVNRGDSIGSAGMTGGVSRPQLHFELRNGSVPVDPLPLLTS